MAITRLQGPLVVPGAGPSIVGSPEYNDSSGPSVFAHGVGLLDNRFGPFGGGDVTNPIPAWLGADDIYVVDQAPAIMAVANIAAAAIPVAGTPLTLVAASGAGITVGQMLNSGTGMFVTARIIDAAPTPLSLAALGGGVTLYDPREAIARNVRVTSASADTGTITIRGLDFYGFPMTEVITMAGIGVVSGKKAFKAIISATPAAPLAGGNVSIGTGDVFGIHLAALEFQQLWLYWNGALVSATTGFLPADVTTPATGITGDVRGTYAVQSASDGTKKLQIMYSPVPWALSSTALFGQPQYAG